MDQNDLENLLRNGQRVEGARPENKQALMIYRYPDGTVMRFKPQGDLYRRCVPTVTIEIMMDPEASTFNLDTMVCKVDGNGHPAPKAPGEIDKQLKKTSKQKNIDIVMSSVHTTLCKN